MVQLLSHTKKGQASTELLFAIGFLMLFFIMITLINFERNSNIKDVDKILDERALCQQISNGISNVYSKGHGTSSIIKLKDHNASFDGINQVILIDDNYPCTIPLKDISWNGTNTTFSFTAQDLRLQNINNVVYINSNCFTYYVSDAEDANGTKYTNKVKYNDNNYANISLVNKINGSITNFQQFLSVNYINISFIDIGNECINSQMNQILQDFGCSDNFQGGTAPPTTNCHIYHDNGHINTFFNNANLLPGYKIIVIEQETLTSSQLDELEDWVEAGGILIYGDRILSGTGNRFGSRWNYVKLDIVDHNWTAVDSFYTSPDPYLELGGTITNKATKDPDASHYITDCTSCDPDAVNYTLIAEFIGGNDAIGRWNYGNGTVYQFPSLCDPVYNYNTGTLTIKINEMIKRMLGSYKYNYLDTVIDFDVELGFNGTSSNITTLEYKINIPSGYNLSLYEKYLGNFILKCTDQTILNNQCIFNPSSLAVNQIRLRTEFSVKELNIINRQVDIDYQDIQICYSL